jgi:hypothetical protein
MLISPKATFGISSAESDNLRVREDEQFSFSPFRFNALEQAVSFRAEVLRTTHSLIAMVETCTGRIRGGLQCCSQVVTALKELLGNALTIYINGA